MNYAALKKTDIANGPGIRVSLFVSGCRRHCKNCFNPETWDFNYGNTFTEGTMKEILDALSKEYVEGFSLLGGEPFEKENRTVVLYILQTIRKTLPLKTIWCYSGFTFEELIDDAKSILQCIDVLVDGEFMEDKKNLTLKFRGSENQRLIDMKKTLKSGKISQIL